MYKVKELAKRNTMFIALILVVLLFEVLLRAMGIGTLFIPSNISNIISQNAYVVILATGMLMCILTGGNIDLSVGAIVVIVGAIAGRLMVTLHLNIYLSIVLCLLSGILIGAWHGFWIAYVRIPAFIVTLSGQMLWRGIAWIILGSYTISPFPDKYLAIFNTYIPFSTDKPFIKLFTVITGIIICIIILSIQLIIRRNKIKKNYTVEDTNIFIIKLFVVFTMIIGTFFFLGGSKGIPVVLVLLTIIVSAYTYFASKTVSGRYLYAMGGNEKAAKLSGINTNKMLFFTYANMGFLSAVAALVSVARFSSAFPAAGEGYELDAIAACFIGGASAYGGIGTVYGVVIGATFMGVLNNGMSLMHIDANWQMPIKGLVLLTAVAFDVISKKRSKS